MNLSTSVSHKATFATLKEIRLKLVSKLSRVPMGYILETPSSRLKSTIIDRVASLESTLAHIIPEMTSNIVVPIVIIAYLFVLDWKMALVSLITLPVGFLCYLGMRRGYEEHFMGLMNAGNEMNKTVVEYINGIEVIKAFNPSANSYERYPKSVNYNAGYAVNWMRSVQLFMSMAYSIWPGVLVAVLPFGCYFYMKGNLIARFYDTTKGTIFVGGHNVREFTCEQL
ncbi:ABC transporter transmembrane domain-containing protein [Clostridium sp. FP1]|uniref:ABC transporter transmembrane domain-containing protein n=1 Tax=Clostridium sp. FP1 TaxID=2724076 RepID=UPI0013E94393|nr:ABC transporter ATP-binding protein/permease [Clostridium sp. FP1]